MSCLELLARHSAANGWLEESLEWWSYLLPFSAAELLQQQTYAPHWHRLLPEYGLQHEVHHSCSEEGLVLIVTWQGSVSNLTVGSVGSVVYISHSWWSLRPHRNSAIRNACLALMCRNWPITGLNKHNIIIKSVKEKTRKEWESTCPQHSLL